MPTFTEGFETGADGAALTPTSLIVTAENAVFDDTQAHTGVLSATSLGGSVVFEPVNIAVIVDASWWTYVTGPTAGWFLVRFLAMSLPSGGGVVLSLDDRSSSGTVEIYAQGTGAGATFIPTGAHYPLNEWCQWTCDGYALTLHRPDGTSWTSPTLDPGMAGNRIQQYLPLGQVWLDDITFTYEGVEPTTFPVLRRFPRDDSLGFGGVGRNYPLPRGRRNYGGQP